jgi:hypothetical protein
MIDIAAVAPSAGGQQDHAGPLPFWRYPMTDYLNMNLESLSKTIRQKATGMRQLAAEALPGDFQSNLLALALDYDRQAERLEQPQPLTRPDIPEGAGYRRAVQTPVRLSKDKGKLGASGALSHAVGNPNVYSRPS